MTTSLILKGAGGRLGQQVLLALAQAPDLKLVRAIVSPRSALLATPLPSPHRANFETAFDTATQANVLLDVSTDPDLDSTLAYCRDQRLALVSGATHFDAAAQAKLRALSQHVPVLHTANFSVGVAVLQQLIALAAQQLGADFQLGILDLHHQHKRDAPSGTAKLLEQSAQSVQSAQHAHLRLGELFGEHRAFS